VIRREFNVAEGDAYNRGLIDAAERRLKQLAPFKSVKITAEDGSTADRVVLDVEVQEQQTGDLSFSGGYSTSVGIIGEVTVSERNFLGLGQSVKALLHSVNTCAAAECRSSSPIFWASAWRSVSTCSSSRRSPIPINPMAAQATAPASKSAHS
jgi:outer membrane protein insertion porin family